MMFNKFMSIVVFSGMSCSHMAKVSNVYPLRTVCDHVDDQLPRRKITQLDPEI